MTAVCIRCDRELTDPGALLISAPPEQARVVAVFKRHLCRECETAVLMFIHNPEKWERVK